MKSSKMKLDPTRCSHQLRSCAVGCHAELAWLQRSENIELDEILIRYFGCHRFKPGQQEAIQSILSGTDTVVIMPTGSGKSLCYQLPAMILPGITLVVSPLIALMKDQVDSLEKRSLPATTLNSTLSRKEIGETVRRIQDGAYKLVYVSPERFKSAAFLKNFQDWHVSLLAVDEAHCISQWGHDFRPDYLALNRVSRLKPEAPIMALTATATPEVREDISVQLGLGTQGRGNPSFQIHGFQRKNLFLSVREAEGKEMKLRHLLKVLEKRPRGIVYCATRRHTEELSQLLRDCGIRCLCYHAGLPTRVRQEVQDRFAIQPDPIIVATNAFGMGVDRPDLRFVVHWDVPGSLEAYYQEVGRAGRDDQGATCLLLYNEADVATQEFLTRSSTPEQDEVRATWDVVKRVCSLGPVDWSLSEWGERIGLITNEITLRNCLALLERSNLIQKERIRKGRAVIRLTGKEDVDTLRSQLEALSEKRERDMRKLKALVRYAHTRRCRHGHILRYFGEKDIPDRCWSCDRCVRSGPAFSAA